ncbi:MAG: hypothetical protein ABSD31_00175 [Candidatus Binataceae bacterium]
MPDRMSPFCRRWPAAFESTGLHELTARVTDRAGEERAIHGTIARTVATLAR